MDNEMKNQARNAIEALSAMLEADERGWLEESGDWEARGEHADRLENLATALRRA